MSDLREVVVRAMWSKIDFKRLTFPWVPLGAVDDDARSVLDEMADAVLAAIGSFDATGDAIDKLAGFTQYSLDVNACSSPWYSVDVWAGPGQGVYRSPSPLEAITKALAAAEAGR